MLKSKSIGLSSIQRLSASQSAYHQRFHCVHFSPGVAFEQGRTLPSPETVPFRLTRDIVDGMGVAGVEGVFRRCCEKTMEVMRASHEELRTIIEVCCPF